MQKFKKGDLVRIAKNLGNWMSHFPSDCDAIVIGSYSDQCGGDNMESYTLYLKSCGRTSWYHQPQLTLIEHGRDDLLEMWEQESTKEKEIKSNLDWIFANGNEVLKKPHSASIAALARCLGVDNLWGAQGEAVCYHENALKTLALASLFLRRGKKAGWLAFCKARNMLNEKEDV